MFQDSADKNLYARFHKNMTRVVHVKFLQDGMHGHTDKRTVAIIFLLCMREIAFLSFEVLVLDQLSVTNFLVNNADY